MNKPAQNLTTPSWLVNTHLQRLKRIEEKFLERIDKVSSKHGCWIWLGRKNAWGYGTLKYGKESLAHRISWLLYKGKIPANICVLHDCPGGDNPSCSNPDHLWLGTRGDNNRDSESKGTARHPTGDAHGFRKHPEIVRRGEQVSVSKMTSEKVTVARKLFLSGIYNIADLSRRFAISNAAMSSILKRKTWKHLP